MVDEVKRGPGRPPKQTDVNDPPMVGTVQKIEMPEQRMIEPDIAPPPSVGVASAVQSNVSKERMEDERFIRVRVRRLGWFIKDLADFEQEAATKRMAKYGRKPEDGWDMSIHIPHFDNASHAHNQQALFEKPVKMIAVEK